MILKIFSPKNSANKLAYLTQSTASLCKKIIKTLVFKKNANFFAENGENSLKIVVITSTPSSRSQLSLGNIGKFNQWLSFTFVRLSACGVTRFGEIPSFGKKPQILK
jgi:hypothetical protein